MRGESGRGNAHLSRLEHLLPLFILCVEKGLGQGQGYRSISRARSKQVHFSCFYDAFSLQASIQQMGSIRGPKWRAG